MIGAINDAPSFVKGADQTVAQDAPAQTVPNWATAISAGPNEGSQTVVFNVTGNTNSLLITGVGQPAVASNGTLTYTPAPGMTGSATITLVAVDNGGTAGGCADTSGPQSFVITVTTAPVNALPTINSVSNLTILEGAPLQTINLSGITAGGDVPAQAIAVTASTDRDELRLILVKPERRNGSRVRTGIKRQSDSRFVFILHGNGRQVFVFVLSLALREQRRCHAE